jgi:signal transduction histidine kinase
MSPASGKAPIVEPAELLRSIAHELRQPLSTIESIAYYLGLILPRHNEKVQDQLTRLQELVEQSNWILTSGLQLADMSSISRAIAPAPVDLEELITQAISERPVSIEAAPRLQLSGGLPHVQLDPALGRSLLENVLGLFRHLATEVYPVTVRTAPAAGGGVSLELATSAPGHLSEAAMPAGTALSLASARKVVEAHRGSLEFNVDPETGILLRVMLR